MNLQLKQRLVGAIVLVSLAVIVIPMLLDGGDGGRMPVNGSNVPPAPDYEFEAMEIPLRLPEGPERVERESPPATPATPEPPQTKPAPRIERKPLVMSKPAETAAPKPLVKPEPAAVAAGAPADADGGDWVVQLGSFSSAGNANALRDRVKKEGFSAFVEKHGTENGPSYRVRVGPVSGREKAEALRDRIERKLQLKGMPMPRSS